MKVSNVAMNLLLFSSAAFFPEIEARNLRHVADDSSMSTTERGLTVPYSVLDAATVHTDSIYSLIQTEFILSCPGDEVMVNFECDMTNDDNYIWSSYSILEDGEDGWAYPHGANCAFFKKELAANKGTIAYKGTITNRIWCIPKADCHAYNGLIELTSAGTFGHCPIGYSLIGSQCLTPPLNSEEPETLYPNKIMDTYKVDGGNKDGYPEGVYCEMDNAGTIQSQVKCIPQ